MIKDIIDVMENDLKSHYRPKESLFKYYIQKRLEESVSSYYTEINKHLEEIKYKDSFQSIKKVIKNL